MDADIIFELQSGNEYDKRCGEIFLTTNGYLLFHCLLCTDKYADYNDYFSHVMEEHFLSNNDYIDFDETSGQEKVCSQSIVTETEIAVIGNDEVENANNTAIIDSDEILFSEIIEDETQDDPQISCINIQENDVDLQANTNKFPAKKKKANAASKLRKYKCTICSRAFKEINNLREHLLRHTGEKNFHCTICSKSFFTNQELKLHVRRHNNERPYLCQECGSTFYSGGSLNSHIKRRHQKIRNRQCPECPKRFYDNAMLKDHMFVHLKDLRPHICTVCNTSFPRRKSLKSHMKLHANIKEYACELCTASFNQKAGLFAHKKRRHKSDI